MQMCKPHLPIVSVSAREALSVVTAAPWLAAVVRLSNWQEIGTHLIANFTFQRWGDSEKTARGTCRIVLGRALREANRKWGNVLKNEFDDETVQHYWPTGKRTAIMSQQLYWLTNANLTFIKTKLFCFISSLKYLCIQYMEGLVHKTYRIFFMDGKLIYNNIAMRNKLFYAVNRLFVLVGCR